ncbi:MAG: hypothetical protein MK207_08970 [Saprospiraceae bacterium]|nr:hypothetical protein [Saprospiraceae bacterium]
MVLPRLLKLSLILISVVVLFNCNKGLEWDLERIDLPVVLTDTTLNITMNSADISGNITTLYGSLITEHGHCWSDIPQPSVNDDTTNLGSIVTTDKFNSNITGLSPSTTYYVRAYATNSYGTSYGNQVEFITQPNNNNNSPPVVVTSAMTNITDSTASASGNITNIGSSTILQHGHCWSTISNPTISDSKNTLGSTNTGNFYSNLTALNANTTYYIRAYATNSSGTAYGNEISFVTSGPILVSTNNCNTLTNVNSDYQGINGTNADWGIGSAYSGNGWKAPDPNNSGQLGTTIGAQYVEFQDNFSKNGYLEFWCNTYDPGYDNVEPTILVDGVAIGSAVKVQGHSSNSSLYWMKVKTPNISIGSHTIKILFSVNYMIVGIDEIEKWEYQ